MNLNYVAVPTFARLHNDPAKYLFVRGPVGSGKSSGCIWHLVLNAMQQYPQHDGVRRSRYGIIRASYPALKSTVIKSWQQWFKSLINIVYDTPIRGEMKLPHPDGETEIHMELVFIALDREEDVNKLQSLELTGMHFNEAAEIPRGVHQMSKSRINRFPDQVDGGCVNPFIMCDYNSVDTEHWLYKMAEEEKPPKHTFYHQPPALLMVGPGEGDPDNPIIDAANNHYIINPDADNLGHHIPGKPSQSPQANAKWDTKMKAWWIPHLAEDYYADQVYGAEPDWVNVMILNNYGQLRTGRPVFAEYQDQYHFSETTIKPIKGVPIIIGMDLGLTPAAAFTQLTPTGEMLVFDELVTEDCSVQRFLEDYLKPHISNHYSEFDYTLVIDPSAMATRSQNDAKAAEYYIQQAALPYRPGVTNNWTKRKESVVYFLRKLKGFRLGPNCLYLRKGFISEYKFEKRRVAMIAGNTNPLFKEKPDKNIYSHIHDALQYACLEHSEGRGAKRKKRLAQQTTRSRSSQDYIGDNEAGY